MIYPLKSSRLSVAMLSFLIIITLLIAVEIMLNFFTGWFYYFMLAGLLLMIFATVFHVYKFFFGRFPNEIETSDAALEIKYEDGKSDRIPYTSILRVWSIPNPSKDSAILHLRGRFGSKTINIIGVNLSKKIAEDISGRLSNPK